MNELWKFNTANGQWTWVSGTNLKDQVSSYGTKGIASVANTPGSRRNTVSWTDLNGNLWLFGGRESYIAFDYYVYNDLWKFNPLTSEWTWVSGANVFKQGSTFGTQGVPSATNIPSSREDAIGWTDSAGNLRLLGGSGLDAFDNESLLHDTWSYNIATNEWTWTSVHVAARKRAPGTFAPEAVPFIP